jgi:hypothetical protein
MKHEGASHQTKAYLAGPMTGYKDYNFPAFMDAADKLRSRYYDIVNPAEIEAAEEGPRKTWEYYLKRDIAELVKCNIVIVLKGWEKSRGASFEVLIARILKMDVFEFETEKCIKPGFYGLLFSILRGEPDENQLISESAVRGIVESESDKENRRILNAGLRGIAEKNSAIYPAGHPFEKGNGETFVEAFTPKEPSYEAQRFQEKKRATAKESVLEEAQRLVGGDRGNSYGHPFDDMTRTGRMWAPILGLSEVTAAQVALCMVCVKISREVNSPKRDNRVDGPGYFLCLDMIRDKEGK